ncbi:MAG: NusA-like transcription termination signal-binding factor [Candidatus Aenigmatarchaeota archaeon]|nr:MAG: NusA-like transcription termination signal-binding factor [Candidatus Aenigmarchaeota archaeon]
MREFGAEEIKYITIFEECTGTEVRDCIVEGDTIYFLVEKGKVGLAIGKNGFSIRNAQKLLRKRIKVFEYDDEEEKFVRNMIPQSNTVSIKNKKVLVTVDIKDRGKVIGKNGSNIKVIKKFLKRNAGIENLELK